jgi:hypothetical protein
MPDGSFPSIPHMTIRFNPPQLQTEPNAETFVRTASNMMEPEIAGELRVLQPFPHAALRLVLIIAGRQPISLELPAGWLERTTSSDAIRHQLEKLLQLLPSHAR